jgi:hypothetical protein
MSNGKTYSGGCFAALFNLLSPASQPAWGIAVLRVGIGPPAQSTPSRCGRRRTCGGHIMTEQSGLGLTDVYAAAILDLPFRPGLACDVNYGETLLHLKDGRV